MTTLFNTNKADLVFSVATLGASVFSYYKFIQQNPSSPIPVHFDWWGNGDNSISDAKTGGLIYPALVALMNGLNIFLNKSHAKRMSQSPEKAAEYRAAMNGQGPLKNILRFLNRSFTLRACSLYMVVLQHYAQETSLGNQKKLNENVLVRPVVFLFAAITCAHYAAGTAVLLE